MWHGNQTDTRPPADPYTAVARRRGRGVSERRGRRGVSGTIAGLGRGAANRAPSVVVCPLRRDAGDADRNGTGRLVCAAKRLRGGRGARGAGLFPRPRLLVVGIWFASALREERTTTRASDGAVQGEQCRRNRPRQHKKTAAPADAREPSASPQSTSADGTPESAARGHAGASGAGASLAMPKRQTSPACSNVMQLRPTPQVRGRRRPPASHPSRLRNSRRTKIRAPTHRAAMCGASETLGVEGRAMPARARPRRPLPLRQ